MPSEERTALKLTAAYLGASLLITAAIIGVDKLLFPLSATWLALVLVFVINSLLALPFTLKARGGRRPLS